MTLALKSPDRPYQVNNGPRTSHSLAWRSGGRYRGALRCTQGLPRTPEGESSGCSSSSVRHLRCDDGAGTRGPSHGGTCRGRACSVPCTRARTSTRASTRAVRDRPAGSRAGDILGAIGDILRSSDAGQEANADLQTQDRSGEERRRFQEDPGENKKALSEKRKTRAWVHKPTLRLF